MDEQIKPLEKEKLRKQKPYDYRTCINGISFSYPWKPSSVLCEWENKKTESVIPFALAMTAALLWKYYKFETT